MLAFAALSKSPSHEISMKHHIAFIACFYLITCPANAEWLQWRGPNFNGSAPNAKPVTEWSATKNVRWKLEIPGKGSGTPAITGDDLFVVTALDTGKKPSGADPAKAHRQERAPDTLHQFIVLCIDRKSGKEKWKKIVAELVPHSGHHGDHFYASASPITDGKHVWAHFGSRGTYCLTVKGDLVWSRTDLGFMVLRGAFGDGSSPALHGDTLVIPWDTEDGNSYIVALDKMTGKTKWKKTRDQISSWATPLIVEHEGRPIVIQNGVGFARAYELKDGEEIWRAGGQTTRPIPTPVYHEGMVFIGSGHRGSFLGAYKLDGAKGDITGSGNEVWTLGKNTPDVPSPLLSGGRLYFHAGRDGILSCVDAKSGKPHYIRQRVSGLRNVYSSPVAADGFVFLTGRDGKTVVIKDGPKFEIVATNDLGEPVDASFVMVGDALYIRAAEHLYCIGEG
jgi:outer membrane protein assembly factor BamB